MIRVPELIDEGNFLLVPLKMNPAGIVTWSLGPLKLVVNMFLRHGPGILTFLKTSWPLLHVGDNFNSYNISSTSNNGIFRISSNIHNTVNKNVQFSIYNVNVKSLL